MHTPETLNARRVPRSRVVRALPSSLLCLSLALISVACSNETRTETGGSDKAGAVSGSASAAKTNASSSATSPGAATPKGVLPPQIVDSKIADTNGGEFSLADYKGKVVVLDLWATWCPPCREEIPHLIAIGKEYKPRGVEVVGVTTEDAEADLDKVRDFARQFGIDYKLGFANEEIQKLGAFGGGSIPQTLVIGRDGTVLMHHAGFSAARTPAKIREAVERGLAQQS